ncbi:MAG: DUF192 domain-containing protein [Campylobacteraceae bacterium]|jgi:uncharacterized membrane protein (UPF0127 family)|nr:DUF192 domain-containing protein [Campylobacteraceae bacterium]
MKFILLSVLFCALLFADKLCDIKFDNGLRIEKLPHANTPKSRMEGLSNLEDVGIGMIFVWDKADRLSFWMKDTRVALSIGFFDDNMELFQIDDMKPHSLDVHHSKKEAKFALELKHGDFEKHNITIGTKIIKLDCK